MAGCTNIQSSLNDDNMTENFSNGIALTDGTEPNSDTKKFDVGLLQNHITSLQSQNIIPMYPDPSGIDNQVVKDKAFLAKIQTEYCFYEQRYTYALKKFLDSALSVDPAISANSTDYLDKCENLNIKLNSILQILDVLNATRISNLAPLSAQITKSNTEIKTTSDQIQKQYALLSSKNAITETQNQMILYTKEKNNYVLNQIALFTIMNAFAIGGIYAIWRIAK
jgi:hypothetical protein